MFSIGIASLPLYWLFDHFGRENLAFPAVIAIAMLAFTAAVKWNLRRKPWFWGTMTILAALHVLLVAFVPWGTRWVPAVAIATIGSADVIVMITILAVVGRIVSRRGDLGATPARP